MINNQIMEIDLHEYQEDDRELISNYVILTVGATVFTYFSLLKFKYAQEGDRYSYSSILYVAMIIAIIGFVKLAKYYMHKGEKMNEFSILTHAKRNYTGKDTLLVFLILYPAAIYLKFKTLHDHLHNDHKNEDKFPPNPKYAFISIIPVGILINMISSYDLIREEFTAAALSLITLFILQLLMYLEIQWNKIFNSHIDKHIAALSSHQSV